MSLVINAATTLHDKHIRVVNRSHDLAVSAVGKVASAVQGLSATSPAVPDGIAGPLEKAASPLTKIVGNKSELTSYLSRSVRDWADVQQRVQTTVLGVLVSNDQVASGDTASAKA